MFKIYFEDEDIKPIVFSDSEFSQVGDDEISYRLEKIYMNDPPVVLNWGGDFIRLSSRYELPDFVSDLIFLIQWAKDTQPDEYYSCTIAVDTIAAEIECTKTQDTIRFKGNWFRGSKEIQLEKSVEMLSQEFISEFGKLFGRIEKDLFNESLFHPRITALRLSV